MGAGTDAEVAASLHQTGCETGRSLIGAKPFFQRALRRRKGGRVGDDEIEAPPVLTDLAHDVEGLTTQGREPVGDACGRRPFLRQRQRGGGAIDGNGGGCAARQTSEREAADMGEDVEHIGALRQPRGEGVVRALVEEKAGLLTADQIGHVGRAVHRRRKGRIDRAALQPDLCVQPFQRPCAARAIDHDGGHAGHISQSVADIARHRIGPGRVRLDHGGVAETVDDEAGEAIALSMDKAVERRVEQAFAMRQRNRQAGAQPVAVNLRFRIRIQDTGEDL